MLSKLQLEAVLYACTVRVRRARGAAQRARARLTPQPGALVCRLFARRALGARCDASSGSACHAFVRRSTNASACAQKHSEFLPDGRTRAGFFIGDGAGVGKGRSISGIILDSYARGRRQHIWLSCSADLCRDAERDLRDLGVHVKVIDGPQALDRETKASGLSKDYQEGVLFCTYSSLTSDRSKNRLDQIVAWCGGAEAFEGVLVFDECHRAKHLCVYMP